jgi:EAL domain-containing protein (putative c-di-GMP-specific phosphodiesterase class I)
VHVEITESELMRDVDTTTEVLERLKVLGVGVAIDDFGTGYSSLSYLHRLPIDSLKIDRSFVSCMTDNAEIVRAIVGLAHNLGLDVIAEGVETVEQLEQLKALGCEFGQGYLFSRPVEHAEAEALLLRGLTPGWSEQPTRIAP